MKYSNMKSLIKKILVSSSLIAAVSVSFAANAANSVIDVMVVYTQGVANLYGGDPTTRFNQLAQVTNQIYRDSGVNLEIRVVKTLLVNYTDDNAAETALNDITYNSNAAFAGVAAARDQAKADMVIFYRPFKQVQGSCGLGWIGGQGTNGDFSNPAIKKYMFTHIAINTCGDYVTAHELGHNMGLKHSRKQDGSGGTFPYALGYGVVNSFTTIMAYQSEFNVDYWTGKIYKFSNNKLVCNGQACGVDRNDAANGADAVYTLNITGPQVSNFYAGTSTVSSSSSSSAAASSKPASSSSSSSSAKSSSVSSVSVVSSAKSSQASSVSSSSNASLSNALSSASVKVQNAKNALSSAQAAVAANKTAIETKTKAEAAALANIQSVTVSLNNAKTTYSVAVAKYNDSAKVLSDLQTKVNAALATYNKALGTAKETARKAYNDLATQFNGQQQLVIVSYNAAVAAQNAVITATVNLNNANVNYAAAQQATVVEKAKTASLNSQMAAAQSAYDAALSAYNNLLASKSK